MLIYVESSIPLVILLLFIIIIIKKNIVLHSDLKGFFWNIVKLYWNKQNSHH